MMQGGVLTMSSMNHFHAPRESISSAFTVQQRKRSSESRAPSTTVRSLRELQWSPSPASRGRMARALSFSRRSRARVLPTKATKLLPPKKGEAERRKGATVSWGHATHRMLPSKCASGAAARSSERARLSALHRGACLGHLPKLDPGRASRDAVRRRWPRLGVALKRSTSRAGRNAGGVDARTARERQ